MLIAAEKKKINNATSGAARPVLLLAINNGAAHIRAAEAIAAAWRETSPKIPARVVDVSDFMSRKARFTHVSAYLWLVKNAPAVWEKIDAYQKRQTQTSPEWFYRRECRKLFDFVREIQPSAIIATEVGCGEIGALIKRDFRLKIPLVAVSLDYEADRAWIQPETDFYCLATDSVVKEFVENGANREQIAALGVPMRAEFDVDFDKNAERRKVNEQFDLQADAPLILVAGGGEGMGKIEAIVRELLKLNSLAAIVVLAGKNEKLKQSIERMAENSKNLRVLGWTDSISQLFRAADVLISKLGTTFDEAMACRLPIIALPPPPGAERTQFELLEKFAVGRCVKTPTEAAEAAESLLKNPAALERMRANAAKIARTNAAAKIALWLKEKIETE